MKALRTYHKQREILDQLDNFVVQFKGTVKLHGTNAGIGLSDKHGLWFQSRERFVTEFKDNFGLYAHMRPNLEQLELFMRQFAQVHNVDLSKNALIVYGEWCGEGVQEGVALQYFEKMFVMFDAGYVPIDECNDCMYVETKLKNKQKQAKKDNKRKQKKEEGEDAVVHSSDTPSSETVGSTSAGVRWLRLDTTPDLYHHEIRMYNIYEFKRAILAKKQI